MPTDLSDCRPEIQRFAVQMERQLRKNDYKGGWRNCEHSYLIKRLLEEVGELIEAMDTQPASGVRKEAADVANFAMMIADRFAE